jgi:hypothetical protein
MGAPLESDKGGGAKKMTEKRLWKRSAYDDTGGYDCMTGAIRIGPAVLDGYDYGQKNCEPISTEALTRMEKDAALIEAAPEMLEALEEALAFLDDGTPETDISPYEKTIRRNVRAVIKKAKGE